MDSKQSFEFGAFRFDAGTRLLLRGGEPLNLGRRGTQLLALLLERRGEVVGKGELIDAAWDRIAVEESNLSVQIAQLRKRLGRAADNREWIATVPRIGYRFIEAEERRLSEGPTVIPALAVLPFDNLSGDAAEDYFADGVVEDLITALSRFKSFATVARNSSYVYKGRAVDVRKAARELGVRYLLEGSVRRAGDRLRITAQLIEGTSGAHVWAHRFDGAVDAVFDVQDTIAESVASMVEPRIQRAEIERSRRERPGSIEAYDLYLRAQARLQTQLDGENMAAFGLFMQALELEPDNVMFLAGASEAIQHRMSMGWSGVTADDRTLCRELARRGLRLTDSDGYAMSLFAMSLFNLRDCALAHETAQRAVEVNPNCLMALLNAGIISMLWADIDAGEALFHRALRLNPADHQQKFVLTGLAHIAMIRCDYETALGWARRSLSVNESYGATYWMLIAANAQLGRMEEARRYLARFRELMPEVKVAHIDNAPRRERAAAIVEGLRLAGME